ncbi:integrase domain-containing protein [Catenovulum adriaticum]|uniref:Integrase domain-containing protein n=1 Tax=Catenovulum adriaticum TaxID=2984846 RepID=A0ABY7AQN3_9ALTE|nr:integrase domain-containing protein [Catenovulum sp. TS8]WAJ71625.1 integrase domain-containing protein [Catenovulum sp. TS8]
MAKVKPLTNTQIKQAKPQEKVIKLADGDGLQLRIRPNGTKTWLLDYINPETKKRTSISLGSYPELSLSEARELRAQARKLIQQKIDPKRARETQNNEKQQKLQSTFELVAIKWFEVKKTTITKDYSDDIWRSLKLHLLPSLGKEPIDFITAQKMIETLKPIEAKGNLETVKRLCQRINEIMTYAVNTGILNHNPTAGIKAAFLKPKTKNMASITPDDLPNFLKTLNRASIKQVTRCLIEWQLHTMVRPGEAVKARWSEIDFENKLWHIPSETMKKNRAHIVPLTEQAIEILEFLKPISRHREFLFPADRDPKKHANEQTANAAIKRMGFKGLLVAHGLRSIASTALNEQGFDPDVIEACLAHVDKNEVRRAYNRTDYLDRRRPVMKWWSKFIEQSEKGLPENSLEGLKVVNE